LLLCHGALARHDAGAFMSQPTKEKKTEPKRNDAAESPQAGAEGYRIASIASQLSPEDREQLRRCINRHLPKLFQ
jgi:hypothetical protein